MSRRKKRYEEGEIAVPQVIPPDADEATLRAIHRQVMDAIKKSREPNALIMPEERRTLVGLAKRMRISFNELLGEIEALRTRPNLRLLPVRDSEAIRIAQVMHTVTNGKSRSSSRTTTMLLSDGVIAEHAPGRWSWAASRGEWIQLGVPIEKALGEPFLRAWEALVIPPNQETATIILKQAGTQDIPQEALVTWMLETVEHRMHTVIQAALEGRPVTLRDLIIDRLDNGGGYRSASFAPMKAAVEAWCVTRNLIAEDLRTAPMFDVPMTEVWTSYKSHEMLANTRAAALRDSVAKALGFNRTYHGGGEAWVKTSRDDRATIAIHDTGRIEINRQFRCVVEAVSVRLPEADQVVRRMLTLATPHRNQISTLKDDLPLLESIWPVAPKIWSLLQDEQVEQSA